MMSKEAMFRNMLSLQTNLSILNYDIRWYIQGIAESVVLDLPEAVTENDLEYIEKEMLRDCKIMIQRLNTFIANYEQRGD